MSDRLDEARVHASSGQFAEHKLSGCIVPYLTNWNHAKLLAPEQFRNVVTDDVQLAVVPHIEQTARPAFVSSECVVALEGEQNSRSQTSHSYQLLVGSVLASGTHSTEAPSRDSR